MLGKIGQFVGAGPGVGGHHDRASACARVPDQEELDAVVHVQQHELAFGKRQTVCKAANCRVEIAVGPALRRSVKRREYDKFLVRCAVRPRLQQPWDILPGEGVKRAGEQGAWCGHGQTSVQLFDTLALAASARQRKANIYKVHILVDANGHVKLFQWLNMNSVDTASILPYIGSPHLSW